ncbi:hypothetical protein [Streptomyces sp. NPDC056387]|uniref:hypothetical protein n=1 Tax=Streptomyces sp. NPDC056387 TaxID=3345803 RepID=UPI0035DF09E2
MRARLRPGPVELEEDLFLAHVERALATAEGFLQESAQVRERPAGEFEVPHEQNAQALGEAWQMRAVLLLACRALGCLLMMSGAVLDYALTSWVSRTAGGFGGLLMFPGVLLVVDPWDAHTEWWPTLRARIHDQADPPGWAIDLANVFTRLLRIGWATAASTGAVLTLAAFYSVSLNHSFALFSTSDHTTMLPPAQVPQLRDRSHRAVEDTQHREPLRSPH